MKQFREWLSRYAWGFGVLLSQVFGWFIQYTWSTAVTTSAAAWFKSGDGFFQKWFHKFIDALFRPFGQKEHCALTVLRDIQFCRDFLEHPKVDHVVLNAEQAAEWRAWQEDLRRVSDIPSSVPASPNDDVKPDVGRNDPDTVFVVGEGVESEVGIASPVEAPEASGAQAEMEPGHKLFDAELWFFSQSDSEKKQIVVDGVSVKMPVEQRRQVARIAQVWWNRNAKSVDGHGMGSDGGQQ